MPTQQFVAKHYLVRTIREVSAAQDTGILTILTDTRRSVLLRFSRGRLIQVHCRTRDVSDAIGVLNECEALKYTFVPAQVENRVEVMPVDTFLQMLAPGADDAPAPPPPAHRPAGVAGGQPALEARDELLPQFAQLLGEEQPASAAAVAGPPADLRETMTRVAMDYVGPMAPILVDDAMEPWVSVGDSIERVAAMIPDRAQSNGFREKANALFLK